MESNEIIKAFESIAERVSNRVYDERQAEGPEGLISVKRAAEFLDIPEDTIRKWIRRRQIPFHQVRGCVRVRLSEIVKTEDAR